jgi:Protein of unknown function (DUF2786)
VMNREALHDKIRALLAKTTANGCTEAEELAALDKARAMMDAYEVTEEELQLSKAEAAVLRAEPPEDVRDPHQIKWHLTRATGQFCDCQIFRQVGDGLKFCGLPGDVEFAMWLIDHLADFVQAELASHLICCLAPRSERRRIIKGFVEGCTGRISDRMVDLCRRSAAERTDNSRALMVIKSSAIADTLKALGIKLRSSSGRCGNVNEAAYEAGRRAGDQASFGRPVSGSMGVLRLGK